MGGYKGATEPWSLSKALKPRFSPLQTIYGCKYYVYDVAWKESASLASLALPGRFAVGSFGRSRELESIDKFWLELESELIKYERLRLRLEFQLDTGTGMTSERFGRIAAEVRGGTVLRAVQYIFLVTQ